MRGLRCLLVGVAVVLALGCPARALNIAPTYQVFELKAGKAATGEFLLTNNEETLLEIHPGAKEWFKLVENQDLSVADWLIVSTATFSLAVGESKKMTFKVIAPKKAKGELVGMATFLIDDKTTVVNKRLSVAVYLAISGTEKIKAEMNTFGLEIGTNSVSAQVLVENHGNVHLRPEGMLQIVNEQNTPMANVTLKRDQPVYPGDRRPYGGVVTGVKLKPGDYTAKIVMQDVDRLVEIINATKKFAIDKKGKVIQR